MNWFLHFFLILLTIFSCTNAHRACCDGDSDCPDFVCQPCSDPTVCPECFPDPTEPYYNPHGVTQACCRQSSAVLALTAASIQASAMAFASAQASASAATKVAVGAATVATSGAFVSICESFSLTVLPDGYCNITSDIVVRASSYASATAVAAAEAEGAANSSAHASAAAISSANAAAKLWSQAESLIESSCCGFNLQVYSVSLIAGQYAVNAGIAAAVAVNVSTSAQDCAYASIKASVTAKSCAETFVNAKLSNCCNTTSISTNANKTATDCDKAIKKAEDLHGIISFAYERLLAYGIDSNVLTTPAETLTSVCATECSDVPLSCCANQDDFFNTGCGNNICQAAHTLSQVILSTTAISEIVVDVIVYSKSVVKVVAIAIANALAATKAATYAAVTLKVDVSACSSIVISIATDAAANASAVSTAFASAQAAALAYSKGAANATALAAAVAEGYATVSSVVLAYGTGCCGNPGCFVLRNYYLGNSSSTFDCCDVTANIINAYSYEYSALAVAACAEASKQVTSKSAVSISSASQDCSNVIQRISTKFSFLLSIPCCSDSIVNAIMSTTNVFSSNTRYITAPPTTTRPRTTKRNRG